MKLNRSFNNLKSLIFVAGLFFVTGHSISAVAQTIDCFEIKYFDFFGLNEHRKIQWPDSELDGLLKTDFRKDGLNTSFLIPLIVFQLKEFDPNCRKTNDPVRYQKLLKLYFRIRGHEFATIQNKSVIEQLNLVRSDFYKQVLDDNQLVHMNYSMDDGPLKGEVPKRIPVSTTGDRVQTDFGQLTIVKNSKKVYLIASDHKKRIIWARIMTGTVPKRYLDNLAFRENPIETTSLATIIHLHTSERLTLYLKNDGRFMYYFHSW